MRWYVHESGCPSFRTRGPGIGRRCTCDAPKPNSNRAWKWLYARKLLVSDGLHEGVYTTEAKVRRAMPQLFEDAIAVSVE